jgi:hypothetical protein
MYELIITIINIATETTIIIVVIVSVFLIAGVSLIVTIIIIVIIVVIRKKKCPCSACNKYHFNGAGDTENATNSYQLNDSCVQ